jgi:carbamoyl-phosphate synthase large subunit
MPARSDINKVLIIGGGPVVIGQGCECDYAAVQACKALREMGREVIMVNSNPAAVSADPGIADRTYIEPLTVSSLAMIIEKEEPDALIPTFGGQTGLYLAAMLERDGVPARYGVKVIGGSGRDIACTENRASFSEVMREIGIDTPMGMAVVTIEEGMRAVGEIGFPAALRPAFSIGGAGSGISYNVEEFVRMLGFALKMSPTGQVMVEKSVLGWKQVEVIVVRDSADNVLTVTSIESFDTAGVHPGNSAAVIPAQTVSADKLREMDDLAGRIARGFDITGPASVRFALGPGGEIVAIGVSPCVGRGMAFAAKALGYPVASVAARLAVGLRLDEIDAPRELGGRIAVKMPRFAFEKFPDADQDLGTSMKAVGESMAVGVDFVEALQKSIRALGNGRLGLGSDGGDPGESVRKNLDLVVDSLANPNAGRLFNVRYALENGIDVGEIAGLTKIDPWFADRIRELVEFERGLEGKSLVGVPSEVLEQAKRLGYSDGQLAFLLETDEDHVRVRRNVLGIKTGCGVVDSSVYLSYGVPISPGSESSERKIVILAGGPNRIGQGGEYDWGVVQASRVLREDGIESIVVNCNPAAVSTDPAHSGKLYLAPLSFEDVMDVIDREKPDGVIVSFGGHTALNLGRQLDKAKVKVMGTPMKSIERVMNRRLFTDMLRKLSLRQMENESAYSVDEALAKADKIGYPALVRPARMSYGRRRGIVYDADELAAFAGAAIELSPEGALVIYKFLEDAIEVTVDAVADAERVVICGAMEHIEQAGVHAGDSASALPPHSLPGEIIEEAKRQTRLIAGELGVRGLMSARFAVKDGQVFVLAVNPRASRTAPFVSRATGVVWGRIAAKVIAGKTLSELGVGDEVVPAYVSVREAVFPFVRFPGADVVLGPEMKSTGQVMGINESFGSAYIKAQIAAEQYLPTSGTVFLSVADRDKRDLPEIGRKLVELGFDIVATRGTAKALADAGVNAHVIYKIGEGRPDATDLIKNGDIHLIVNTRSGKKPRSHEITIRGAMIARGIPIITTIAGAKATFLGMETVRAHGESVRSLQE